MPAKPKMRLELDWSWLRACFELTAQEKRALSLVIALALLGIAARSWVRLRERANPRSTATTEDVSL